MKCKGLPDLLLLWSTLLVSLYQLVSSDTRIVAKAPVDPVDQHGILAVHCQVWNMQGGDEVVILRRINDETEKLSDRKSSDGPDADLDDRVFIAMRQMEDGSTVYFLSLTGATEADAGEYSCKVIRFEDSIREVATDSVPIAIVHFPSESKCSTNIERLREGTPITMNCSSAIGNPSVDISWKQVGSTSTLPSKTITSGGYVYSELTIRPRANDPVYICEIRSSAFPDLVETCHVGPLNVIRDPNSPRISTYFTRNIPTTLIPFELTQEPKIKSSTKCSQICATRTTDHQFYWIVGTVFMAILAMLFFIIFVGLLTKYLKRLRENNNRTKYKAPYEQRPHKVYEELEIRRCGGQVYMALDKTKSTGRESTYTDGQVECLDNVTNEPMILR